MSATTRLNLPYIAPLQAQKHITYNEAMAALDALVQPGVKSRTGNAPPAEPAPGDAYLVAPDGEGAWAGKAHHFAFWADEAWQFRAPADGWLAFVADSAELVVFRAGAWVPFASNGGAALAKLGINADADLANRLAVASEATLFTHAGASHRLKINKAAGGDTASVVFQTGYAGRAEIGLAGADDLSVKVSADGAAWQEALRIAGDTGRVALASGQLGFPSPPRPSPDARVLDDYEEANFTPSLAFGGSGTGITYAVRHGRATKIGRAVFVVVEIALTSKGTATGAATLVGLALPSAGGGPEASFAVGTASGFGGVTGAPGATLPANGLAIDLWQTSAGTSSKLTDAHFTHGARIAFSGHYFV